MTTPITIAMEGMLLNWIKSVGDSVKTGDIIAEVEADKATIEVAAESDGVLLEQSVKVGDNIANGQTIGLIGANGEAPVAAAPAAPAQAVAEARAAGTAVIAAVSAAPEVNGNLPDGVKASPIARKMAEERGIDLRQVTGSGPGGRIVKEDVEAFNPAKAAPAAPAPVALQQHRPPLRHLPQHQAPDSSLFRAASCRKAQMWNTST